MTQEEYIYYSECRQASFTYKKLKKFRDWVNFSSLYDTKPSTDVLDVLGFLAYEMVSVLTETGIKIKREENHKNRYGRGGKKRNEGVDNGNGADDGVEGGVGYMMNEHEGGLFAPQIMDESPLQPKHIHDAFRRLQVPVKNAMSNYNGAIVRRRVTLI